MLSLPFSRVPPGMELFEEALQKWEQALNIRHNFHSSSNSSTSLALQAAASVDVPSVRNIDALTPKNELDKFYITLFPFTPKLKRGLNRVKLSQKG